LEIDSDDRVSSNKEGGNYVPFDEGTNKDEGN
jgi:hypothetical protein